MKTLKQISTDKLINELIERGFKWGYVYGHGTDEPAGYKNKVIADVEKTNVLIRPEDQLETPIDYYKYF